VLNSQRSILAALIFKNASRSFVAESRRDATAVYNWVLGLGPEPAYVINRQSLRSVR